MSYFNPDKLFPYNTRTHFRTYIYMDFLDDHPRFHFHQINPAE